MKSKANGIEIWYELSGKENAPIVALSHSLGSSSTMWEPQIAALEPHFHVLKIDTRGHGGTQVTSGAYDLDLLGDDEIALLDVLNIDRVHWVGLSMGGMIGQNLALRHPQRLLSLSLCDTMARIPEAAGPVWLERIATAEHSGMHALVDSTLERWFTDDYRQKSPPGFTAIREQFLETDVRGFVGCSHAIREMDYLDDLRQIKMPVQIIVGDDDLSTPVALSEDMHARLPRSKLTVLTDARHLSNIEQAEQFNQTLLAFLSSTA